jgi:hypothetical protein
MMLGGDLGRHSKPLLLQLQDCPLAPLQTYILTAVHTLQFAVGALSDRVVNQSFTNSFNLTSEKLRNAWPDVFS